MGKRDDHPAARVSEGGELCHDGVLLGDQQKPWLLTAIPHFDAVAEISLHFLGAVALTNPRGEEEFDAADDEEWGLLRGE